MELIPSEPPGNAKRKLRGLVEEISRLRDQGYSIRVIHDTLAKAGIQVSRATVHRELNRPLRQSVRPGPLVAPSQRPHVQPQQTLAATAPPTVPASPASTSVPGEPDPKTVKQMSDVDEFFELHIANPLFRKKGSP